MDKSERCAVYAAQYSGGGGDDDGGNGSGGGGGLQKLECNSLREGVEKKSTAHYETFKND